MSAEARLAELGLELPNPPVPLANYVPWRIGGGLLFLSGVGPRRADGSSITGVLGAGMSVEEGYAAARLCGLNLLTNMRAALGSLDRVDTILKVLGMVRGTLDFGGHPEVINGCTDLFVEVFGDNGRPARSAVGMGSLPRGIAVEIEAVVLIKG
ncbi:RidA family protein [Falsiroseomonas stagni]|uniref:Enamine deaminase RidA, house cleaning of reactive enamine intermediates, YjgF/YER057c/UK114 family n=1 Tax=Falsiroseomonas stagni DSM 19981 TaxID=1123062 RepID=A0A1I4CHT9_9PROT|nr:RidA family protein [Falsiroseomonas stagni]SFK80505.1 Enamine deaminase RidA, house cleaning of reactive enamine intermediates, YjgF/YER057c/UK114 family [Falsiroseomonas stagni DSM 19981]